MIFPKNNYHQAYSNIPLIIGCFIIIALAISLPIVKNTSRPTTTVNLPDEIVNFKKPEKVDTTIKNNSSPLSSYNYMNISNNFHTYFKNDPVDNNAVKFLNQYASISFYTLKQQNFATASFQNKPVLHENTIFYPEIFPNIDLKYTINSSQLLEEFIVKNQTAATNINKIIQEAVTQNVDNYQENDGQIIFYHQNQKTFIIPKPVLYELDNQQARSYGIKYEISPTSTNKYTINKIITAEGQKWLNDSQRNYPIVIDLVIDNADTVGNWTTSDSINTPISQETNIKEEGTASIRVDVTGYQGTGADGACTVSSTSNDEINTESCVGRSNADAVNFSLIVNSAIGATAITLPTAPTGLAVGDEILIINLQGTSSNYTNVGLYEFNTIIAINSNTLILNRPLQNTYDGTTQTIMVQRVPQYTNVTINSGLTFRPMAWNHTRGGVIAFKATGTVTIAGSISTSGLGYYGGTGGIDLITGSGGGESFCNNPGGGNGGQNNSNGSAGLCGGGGGGGYNLGTVYYGAAGSASLGGGGGGGGAVHYASYPLGGGGGGGGYGTYGIYGSGTNNGVSGGTNTSGAGGNGGLKGGGGGGGGTYGNTSIDNLYLGSGGGGGGGAYDVGGTGGKGGGIIYISANSINVTGTISANGGSGGSVSYGGGGGGGAGGSIKIFANTLTIGTNLISASAGSAGTSTNGSAGGSGGDGRIYINYLSSLSGSTSSPSSSSLQSDLFSLNNTISKSGLYNLVNSPVLRFWIRSNLSGQNLRLQFGESTNSEQTYDITVNSANTWEQKTWNISSISNSNKDAVTKFAFLVTNANKNQTFYFDDISTVDLSMASNCLISESPTDSYLNVKWNDNSTSEDGYTLQRRVDSSSFSDLINLSAGTTGYTDSSVSSGHIYQYRIAPYISGPYYGQWCETPTLDLTLPSPPASNSLLLY